MTIFQKNRLQNRFLKLFCVSLCFILIFSSCKSLSDGKENSDESISNSEEQNQVDKPKDQITVAFDNGDSLNPLQYKKEINSILIPLLYDSLIVLDENFVPTPVIAEKYQLSGTTCNITLKSDIKFSDGTKLTADDVVYSYNSFMGSSSILKYKTNNISKIRATSKNSVEITLKQPDKLFVNLLDLPIIKKDSAGEKIPTGSGRYVYQTDDNGEFLNLNTHNSSNQTNKIKRINLHNIPDNDAVIYGVKTGVIDYTLVSPSKISSYNTISSHTSCVSNNLVYLGTNNAGGLLADVNLRKVIFMALNRVEITSTGYAGFAVPSLFPVNPYYSDFSSISYDATAFSRENAIKLLDENGFKNEANKAYRQKDGKQVTLKLIVNKENSYKLLSAKVIKSQLEEIGIQVEIEQYEFAEFNSKVSKGEYDLYLGEVGLSANMDLSPFFGEHSLISNKDSFGQTSGAYSSYKNGNGSMEQFLNSFSSEVPFIPLHFSKGVALYSRDIATNIKATIYDCFFNITNWE